MVAPELMRLVRFLADESCDFAAVDASRGLNLTRLLCHVVFLSLVVMKQYISDTAPRGRRQRTREPDERSRVGKRDSDRPRRDRVPGTAPLCKSAPLGRG